MMHNYSLTNSTCLDTYVVNYLLTSKYGQKASHLKYCIGFVYSRLTLTFAP